MYAWLRKQGWWLAAIAAGAALRAVFLWTHPRFEGDPVVYADLAHNLITHHIYGLTENVIRPTLIRLPGYPFFLALCFSLFGQQSFFPAVCVQIVLALTVCWFLARMAMRLAGERAGLCVLWLLCLCPFTAQYDALPLTESLAIICTGTALICMERWRATGRWGWTLLLGVACAADVLLRPDRGLLAAICVLVLLLLERGRAWKQAVAVCLIVAAPLSVWTVRNWETLHVFQPLAPKYANDAGEFVSNGFNRWYRSWGVEYLSTVNTYWMWDGAPLCWKDLPERAFDSPQQRLETKNAYAAYNAVLSATPANDRLFAHLADERERAHPLRSLVVMPLGRLADMWLRPRTEFFRLPLAWWRWSLHPGASSICLLWAALNAALLLLALRGAWLWRGWSGSIVGLAGLGYVLARCLLLLTIDNAEQRYTVECFPVVLLLAGFALARKTPAPEAV
ncbi:MAG: glycosyltransferase family 39 protein [Acidobacteriaceae bacterium]|nr:glycosyltransferase family 39 protein [Acidobacteriaceae bacterium]